jgi:hypothetical protein
LVAAARLALQRSVYRRPFRLRIQVDVHIHDFFWRGDDDALSLWLRPNDSQLRAKMRLISRLGGDAPGRPIADTLRQAWGAVVGYRDREWPFVIRGVARKRGRSRSLLSSLRGTPIGIAVMLGTVLRITY